MTNIILDCDDVLLDWQTGFIAYLSTKHNLDPDPALLDDWNMDEWLGRDALPLIAEFNASKHFGHIAARHDASAVVPMLYHAGHNLVVLTACSTDDDVVARRKLNLYCEFSFVFSDIMCVPLGESKKSILEKMPPSVFIEDSVSQAKHGVAAGHEVYVMRRNHNIKLRHEPLRWIDSFYDLVSRFT